MRPSLRLTAALGLTATLAFLPPASATLLIALDLPSMVARADQIAVVDVASVASAWDEGHRRIVSTIELRVVENWKGGLQPGGHLRIVQPGGTVGTLVMTIDGMPRFSPGERALVFLRGRPDRASVVGMAQGKRPLHRDAATGNWVAGAADRAGADYVPDRSRGGAATTARTDNRARTLDELRLEIGALVRKSGGAR